MEGCLVFLFFGLAVGALRASWGERRLVLTRQGDVIARLSVVLTLIAATAAAEPGIERPINVSQPGPQRLDVDLLLLAGAAPRLADLRIYDRREREVPYLLVEPADGEARWLRTRRFVIAPTKTTSGVEADAGGLHTIDALRVEEVPSPFLKRVRVEGSGDRHRWDLLADTTLFDLPDEELERTVVEFPATHLRYVRLTWDDSSSARVGGTARVALRAHGTVVPAAPLRAGVPFRKRPSEPGRSRYRVQLPGRRLPLRAIEIVVPAGDVFRRATVSEPRLAGSEIVPETLGSAQLRQAERHGVVASDTSIPITPPLTQEIDIVIEDESNRPLEIARMVVEVAPQPWIYFEAADAGSFTARYGDPARSAPQYDLEAVRPFVDRAPLATAAWLPARSVAAARSAAARPLPATGAAVDRDAFAVARRIAAAPGGMSVLLLDADVLARSRDLRDVRLVDPDGHQVPFIVQHLDEPLIVGTTIGPRQDAGETVSSYEISLPYRTLPSGTRLVITTAADLFERNVVLVDRDGEDQDPVVVGNATWRHIDPDRGPPALTFHLPRRIDGPLELRIEEGDNPPLPIENATLLFPSFALRFQHPGKPLTLVYDNPLAASPRYDLALLAPRIFGEPAQQVTFASAASPGATGDGGIAQHFFWMAIAAVALALMLLLARLLRPLGESRR